MFTRTGGTRPRSATTRRRPLPAPVASALVPDSRRAVDGVLPATTAVLSVLVNIRRGRRLPNCYRNAALRREQSHVFLSNTKTRRAKLGEEQLERLAGLGLEWAAHTQK